MSSMYNKKHNNQIQVKENSYRFELFITIFTLVGFYFILTDVDLAASIRNTVFLIGSVISNLWQSGAHYLVTVSNQLELSDIVGIFIITFTTILAIHRLRHRLVFAHHIIEECPKCGGILARKHRTTLQRIITISLGLKSAYLFCLHCDHQNLKFSFKIPQQGLS